MNLEKLTNPELHDILSAQTKILADNRARLKPEQSGAITKIIDELVKEINLRKKKEKPKPLF